MIKPLAYLSLAVAVAISAETATAQPCDGLTSFSNRQIVFWDREQGVWSELQSLSSLGSRNGRRTYKLAYIIDDRKQRKGVVVIKYGREPRPSGKYADGVRLHRDQLPADAGNACTINAYPKFDDRVEIDSYDGFHDLGNISVKDIDKLRRFHIKYVNRNGECDTTDNPNTGSKFFRRPSNRSQFSFDPDRVDNGIPITAQLSSLFVTPAFADSRTLVDRRAEIRKYTTDGSGFACIVFYAKADPDAKLRVIDLEARDGGRRIQERRK